MSDLARQLIAENKKTRATFLDLGNCALSYIPEELGELVWLEGLSFYESLTTFSVSQIRYLPNHISGLSPLNNLKNLQGIDLHEMKVTDLSPLSELVNLQSLALYCTKVIDLSPLSELINLQKLVLYENEISSLSPLSKLIALQYLDMSFTKITDRFARPWCD